MSGQGSRLQKLLRLIDGGSSLDTRKAAAEQIAAIVKNHPSQLPSVVSEISRHLRHKDWDTRVAAGHCLGAIAEHFLHHTPTTLQQACRENDIKDGSNPSLLGIVDNKEESTEDGYLLTFNSFDVDAVLEQGTPLLASGGAEYDLPDATATGAAGVAQQRANLKKRLGLGGAVEAFMDTADLIADEDLLVAPQGKLKQEEEEAQEKKKDASELLDSMVGMSARERAAAALRAKSAKRKAGIVGKPAPTKRSKTTDGEATAPGDAAAVPEGDQDQTDGPSQLDAELAEQEWQEALSGQWPFQHLCDRLCLDLFHPAWEVRHGAALALRDILGSQASSAALHAPVADPPMGWSAAGGAGRLNLGPVGALDVAAARTANAGWLEDCAIHMLCTLALDRFGDYVSDQVVAPVRETTAQALGAVARSLVPTVISKLVSALRALAECSEWEARHGGLQGLKYVLAACDEVDAELFAAALPASVAGLQDRDDDVRAVAAEALLPAAHLLATATSNEASRALGLLWDALLTLEDLSPATKGATTLLAAVYSCSAGNGGSSSGAPNSGGAPNFTLPGANSNNTSGGVPPLSQLVPRLWPHLRHPLSSVRLAATKCLASLLQSQPIESLLPGPELSRASRIIFQMFLQEGEEAVLQQSQRAWSTLVSRTPVHLLREAFSNEVLAALFTLGSTPPNRKFDSKLMVSVPLPGSSEEGARLAPSVASAQDAESDAGRTTRMRLIAAEALGQFAAAMDSEENDNNTSNPTVAHIVQAMRSNLASARVLGGATAAHWALLSGSHVPTGLQQAVDVALEQLAAPPVAFTELASLQAQVKRQATALAASTSLAMPPDPFTAEAALALAAQASSAGVSPAAQALHTSATTLQMSESVLRTSAAAALAAAVVHSGALPAKLNSLIQPLIAATRREPQPLLQDQGARALARLAASIVTRTPSPTDKIIKNVCGFACGDTVAVPSVLVPPVIGDEVENSNSSAAAGGSGAGAGSSKGKAKGASSDAPPDPAAEAAALTRRGGEAALRSLATEGGAQLPTALPGLWEQQISAPLASLAPTADQSIVNALHVLEVIAPALHHDVVPAALALLPRLAACLGHTNTAIQLSAARAMAALTATHTNTATPPVLDVLTPLLAAGASDACRLGGVVAAREIVSALGLKMVPYVQLAVVPLLGRMSDVHPPTRAVASRCFAAVVALMPLAHGVPPPAGLSAEQQQALERDGGFLQQLLDNRQMEDYKLPFELELGSLRRYQQEGVNWLAFLRRFGLHGVLADDMGTGKTLQATSIVAATAVEQRQAFKASGAEIDRPRPSLIVCPATLVAHWPHEIAKFVGEDVLRPLQYNGSPSARTALRPLLASHDVLVMSYEALRADVDWVSGIKWAYCVLDEGHMVRNPASKVAQAARRVDAQHRVILSGTPIQNSVLEMWALFDFLMPGFLGAERAFNARYGKALAASRGAKRGSVEAEAGVLALDALHRQVMPFVLRRTKDQVLSDLPPKTVQDVMCEPSELQRVLYEDFAASQAMQAVTGAVATTAAGAGRDASAPPHVFQALHYLRRLCSHPVMVLDKDVPAHSRAMLRVLGPKIGGDWPAAQERLRADLSHSPKLAALRELLIDCGIGTDAEGGKGAREADLEAADAGHRALVFAQTRAMLDLVESSVLAPMGVASLRIDGAVEAGERFRRVQRFNGDPTIEVMLLTTAVGGLGLNLTAADTVFFLEHDWNPQKDLQAMDRAHRLGQRRAVNVYRLLVRGTLEEQVMSLQRFKLDVAEAVVNAENMSLAAMDTGNLLDLFTLQEEGAGKKGGREGGAAGEGEGSRAVMADVAGAAAAAGQRGGMAAVLAELTDPVAAEAQYGEEFDLEAFKKRLLGKKG